MTIPLTSFGRMLRRVLLTAGVLLPLIVLAQVFLPRLLRLVPDTWSHRRDFRDANQAIVEIDRLKTKDGRLPGREGVGLLRGDDLECYSYRTWPDGEYAIGFRSERSFFGDPSCRYDSTTRRWNLSPSGYCGY